MTDKELRELDAWIAEHVMGWRKVGLLANFIAGTFLCNTSADCLAHDWKKESRISTWKPTTDTAAAMEVLKKCLSVQTEIHICQHWEGTYGIIGRHDVVGETFELAICLFAKTLFTK